MGTRGLKFSSVGLYLGTIRSLSLCQHMGSYPQVILTTLYTCALALYLKNKNQTNIQMDFMSLVTEGESLTGDWLGFNRHKADMMFSVCMADVNTLLESLII